MDTLSLQQTLDTTGLLKIPAGVYAPSVPLFLDNDARIDGDDSPRSLFDCDQCTTAIVTGMKRGLVPDPCFTGNGYRTISGGVKTFLQSRSCWSFGPQPLGWASVRRLKLMWQGTTNQGSWWEVPLMGMQGRGLTNDKAHPAPWSLYFEGDKLVVALSLSDGNEYLAKSVPLTLPAQIVVTADINLNTGSLELSVNGAAYTSNPFPANLSLNPNTVAPFCVGRLEPHFVGSGYWGEWTYDITIEKIRIDCDGQEHATLNPWDMTRVSTYVGGASLPLVNTHAGGKQRNWLFAITENQNQEQVSGNQTLSRLNIKGTPGAPAVVLGPSFGIDVRNTNIQGGCCGIQGVGPNVQYPLALYDCNFRDQTHSSIWLMRAIMSADRLSFRYAKRTNAELFGCSGSVGGDMIFVAPSDATQIAGFIQRGGQMTWGELHSDYEYLPHPDYALVHIQGDSFDSPDTPTTCKIVDSSTGPAPIACVLRNAPGYLHVPQVECVSPITAGRWLTMKI